MLPVEWLLHVSNHSVDAVDGQIRDLFAHNRLNLASYLNDLREVLVPDRRRLGDSFCHSLRVVGKHVNGVGEVGNVVYKTHHVEHLVIAEPIDVIDDHEHQLIALG